MSEYNSAIFKSEDGEALYNRFLSTVARYKMDGYIEGGVLVALSGGADSVLLLYLIMEYRARLGLKFNISACHVNHMIRGEESDRDETFVNNLCTRLDIPLYIKRIDVPSISIIKGIGIEEAAREARYSAFDDIISNNSDISCVATAHNSTDNCETVIFNISRGSSLKGASGIAPIRDNIIRPLIDISKDEVRKFLTDSTIDFVIDSTNNETDYTRNYIRHNILPHIKTLNPSFERSFSNYSYSARQDDEYLSHIAEDFVSSIDSNAFEFGRLKDLPYPIFSRVISRVASISGATLERVHIDSIYDSRLKDNFTISCPMQFDFVVERGLCSFKLHTPERCIAEFTLEEGINQIDGFNGAVIVNNNSDDSYLNIYKSAISVTISSDIIVGCLRCRSRQDGDSYRYGGHNRKLKKVFNDYGIPPSLRDSIPVITDDAGIIWVPGLPGRDGSATGGETITLHFVTFDGDREPIYSVTHMDIEKRKGNS